LMTPNSGRLVAWRSAEQLLGPSGELDPAPPSSMSTFVHFEKPCRCKICSQENPPSRLQLRRRRGRGEKTKTSAASTPPQTAHIHSAIPDAALTTLRPVLIREARRHLFARSLELELGEVLTAMRPTLLRVARVQLLSRGLDEQNAEDLVQDAIVRWFDRVPEYRGRSALSGWLLKSMRWIAAEGLRGRDLLDHGCASLDEPWARD